MHESQLAPLRSSPSALARVAGALGLRRVEQVRVIVGPTWAIARATVVVHRYPRTVAIPLSIAGRLVAAGAPLHIEYEPVEMAG